MTEDFRAPPELLRAQALANLSDNKIRIPVIGIRLGLDFIIGLIPGVGDFIMACVSMFIVRLAMKMGVPKSLIFSMLKNILIDFLLGLIPVVGDFFDLFYKSNEKNVRLMEMWWVSRKHQDIKKYSQEKLAAWEKTQN
ncbi:DUF4112 domain-containing protein [Paraglaciecola sp. 2405UD69-4]|uniref:DUF4112 domain-containing protein n=1 Tax=Paraglaciecola sp. 2405UD69-4 TaxID=3391836 RepID=UPI0039C9EC6C